MQNEMTKKQEILQSIEVNDLTKTGAQDYKKRDNNLTNPFNIKQMRVTTTASSSFCFSLQGNQRKSVASI